MRKLLLFTYFSFFFSLLQAQLTCGTTMKTLSAGNLGNIPNNSSSYTYAATTYNMPLSMTVAKVAGNGPNFYHTSAGNSIWVGKDNGISLDYEDVVITFSGDVLGVSIDFEAINNNSDGEEQIQNIYPQTAAGVDVTTGVTYQYQAGLPNGTSTTATQYLAASHKITCDAGTGDGGRLNITSTTPFRKVRFRHREITNLSFSGPNGVYLQRIAYCPSIPDIYVAQNSTGIANNGNFAFGTTAVGTPVSKVFNISNMGNAPLLISNTSVAGAAFSLANAPTSPVVAGASVSFTVVYNPSAVASHTGTISISSNDWNENPFVINLAGTAISPEIEVSENGTAIPATTTHLIAGSTQVGNNNTYLISINNSGASALTLGAVNENSVETSIGTQPSASVAAGGSTTFSVVFAPTSAGTKNVTFSFSNNDLDENPYTFTLQFTAIPAPMPEVNVLYLTSPIANNSTFSTSGSTSINATSSYVFTIENTGTANLTLGAVTENHTETSISSQPATTIAAGTSTTFTLQFTPTSLGTKNVTLSFSTNDANENPYSFNVMLNAVNGFAPEISVLQGANIIAHNGSISIAGTTNLGAQNDYVFTIKNAGTGNLTVGTVTEAHSETGIAAQPMTSVNVSGQTAFTLRFSPTSAGTKTIPITIPNDDANENPYLFNVLLTSVAITPTAPEITLTQAGNNLGDGSSFAFGSTNVGTQITKVFTITNIGTTTLTLSNVTLGNTSDFTVTAQPSVLSLVAGATTSFSVRYNALISGTATSTLSFTNNDANENPFNLILTASSNATTPTLANCNGCDNLNVNSNPPHEANWMDRNPKLKWQHDEGRGITYYKVEVKKDAGGGNYSITVNVNGLAVNTVTAPTSAVYAALDVTGNVLSFNAWYQWKVMGYNAANAPVACFQREFKVVPTPAVHASPNSTCNDMCAGCGNIPYTAVPFGTILGDFNNIPIYKNGACVTGMGCGNNCYNPSSGSVTSQSGWSTGWQCVEYPHRYYEKFYNGMNIGRGNGRDYYSVQYVGRQGFRQLKNGATATPPQAGDIVTFDSPNATWGHTAIVKSVSPAIQDGVNNYTLNFAQQNIREYISSHLNGSVSLKRRNGKWVAGNLGSNKTLGWIRGIPQLVEPGDNNSVPILQTTTPDFIWAKHKNIKKYVIKLFKLVGDCYQEVGGSPITVTGNNFSGLSFPALSQGDTYKWYVTNYFTNGKSIRGDAYYFKVATTAQATATQATVIAAGGNRSHLLIHAIGSQIDNAYLFFKSDSTWNILGRTERNGTFELEEEMEMWAGDSLMIQRVGYSPMKMRLTNEMLSGKLYLPMFDNVAVQTKVKAVLNNQQLISTSANVSLKVTGQNFDGFILGGEGWGQEANVFTANDSLVAVTLQDSGLNILSVHYFKGTDTFSVNTQVYYLPSLAGNTYQVSVNNPTNAHFKVLLGGVPIQDITNTTFLTLPLGRHELSFMGFGYETESFTIDTTATLNLNAQLSSPINYTTNVNFATDSVQYVGGFMSVKYTGNQTLTISRQPANVGATYTAISETFSVIKPLADNEKLQFAVVIDKDSVPYSNFYVLITRNGVTNVYQQAQFGDSIVYEPQYQILKFLRLQGNEQLTLVKTAAPLPVTFVGITAKDKLHQAIQVNWLVAQEKNNDFFELERSVDKLSFTKIATIDSKGDHSQSLAYQHDDYNVLPEITYYYRVKAIDIDGKFSHSDLASARIVMPVSFTAILYPNPASQTLHLQVVNSSANQLSLEIFNALGQVVLRQVQALEVGNQVIDLDISKLANTNYTLHIKDENGTSIVKKFVKM
ncbi:MAG: choice-of-anchor D domain-containing protein [Bacteroidia bacterium]